MADPTGGNSYLWRDTQATYATVPHEIRFSNAEPQQLEWVAGANYYQEDLDDNDQNWATYEFASPANGCMVNAPNLLYDCNSPSPAIEGPTQHKCEGVFGQANYHVTDEWMATLGARYSHDSMYRHATIDGGGPQPTTCFPPNPCTAGVPDVGSESSSKVTWRVGLQEQFLPNQMVYGYVASGYKPGGFNDSLYGQTKATPYDPEQLIAYELGYKGQVVPNVQFNSSIYYYDFQKYQVTAAQFFGFGLSGPIITVYTKVAPATAYGWENEVHWKVTPNDQFDAALSLERAYYRSLNVGFISANPISFSGKSLDNVPRAAATLGYEHRYFSPQAGPHRAPGVDFKKFRQLSQQFRGVERRWGWPTHHRAARTNVQGVGWESNPLDYIGTFPSVTSNLLLSQAYPGATATPPGSPIDIRRAVETSST